MSDEIDHGKRIGKPYEPKTPRTQEERQRLSLAMKEFNKRTGRATRVATAVVNRTRKPKPATP